jgi:hypothetical protein
LYRITQPGPPNTSTPTRRRTPEPPRLALHDPLDESIGVLTRLEHGDDIRTESCVTGASSVEQMLTLVGRHTRAFVEERLHAAPVLGVHASPGWSFHDACGAPSTGYGWLRMGRRQPLTVAVSPGRSDTRARAGSGWSPKILTGMQNAGGR